MNYVVAMATKETIQTSQFGSESSYYGSYGIMLENIMYPGWKLVVENIGSVKITKLTNM